MAYCLSLCPDMRLIMRSLTDKKASRGILPLDSSTAIYCRAWKQEQRP